MRQLKLIWDFRGPDAHKIAQHHEKHLLEYCRQEQTAHLNTGCDILNEHHSIAYMVVNEDEMKPIRDALKPHRGQVYKE